MKNIAYKVLSSNNMKSYQYLEIQNHNTNITANSGKDLDLISGFDLASCNGCAGTLGTLGSVGSLTGTFGSFGTVGTAGSYGCGS